MGGIQQNKATPTQAAKPIAPRGDAAKRALLRQDDVKLAQNQVQTQAAQAVDGFHQAEARPGLNPALATRMSQSAEVADTSVNQLKTDDKNKAKLEKAPPKGTVTPPQFSYTTQLRQGLDKLKSAFNRTAEMLVGEKFSQGQKYLSSIELTKKQSDTLARALSAQSSVIRTAFIVHALLSENGVVAKIKAKNEDNENIDPVLVAVACEIAAGFGKEA
jgi:hypothetical protein